MFAAPTPAASTKASSSSPQSSPSSPPPSTCPHPTAGSRLTCDSVSPYQVGAACTFEAHMGWKGMLG